MKIGSWEELDGIKNETYKVFIFKDFIAINKHNTPICQINYMKEDIGQVLLLLYAFGFSVEFKEKPVLTKQEWHCLQYLSKDWWIVRNKNKELHVYKERPVIGVTQQFEDLVCSIVNSLFLFIEWGNEPVQVSILRELDVEESECQHNKIYSDNLLLSKPPKVEWTCSKCLTTGYEVIENI